jgi:uncharacterized repeat protein (TIGR01451 family)
VAARPAATPGTAAGSRPATRTTAGSRTSSRRTAQPSYRADDQADAEEVPQQAMRQTPPGYRPATPPSVAARPPEETAEPTTDIVPEADTVQPEPAAEPAEDIESEEAAASVQDAEATAAPTRTIPTRTSAAAGTALSKVEQFVITRNSPALRVSTTGPKRLLVNQPQTFKVTVENAADVPAKDVTVTVQIPAWAEFDSATATSGEAGDVQEGSGHTLKWAVRTIQGRSREDLTMRLIVREGRPIDLAVQWSCAPLATTTVVEVAEARLELALAGPEEVSFGAKSVYRLTFSNPGTADAQNVAVRLLPLAPGDQQVETHQIGTVAAGDTKEVEIELVARQTGRLSIQVEATADGGLATRVEEQILVRRAGLEVVVHAPKFQYAGAVASYEVTVKNPGDEAARDVAVTAALPRGARYLSCTGGGELDSNGTSLTWKLGRLEAGGETALTIKCALAEPGRNQIDVAATAASELSHAATAATAVEALADLVLDVTDPQGPVPVGEEVLYEVTVKNRGARAAEDVEIVAFFSEGIEPVAVEGGAHELAEGKVAFETVASIAAGEERVFKIKARAEQGGNHVVRTEVHCPSLDTSLAEEETTRFYKGDESSAEPPMERANRPNPTRAGTRAASRPDAGDEVFQPSTQREPAPFVPAERE